MSDRTPGRVTIVEVGPRDGLQNESAPIPTAAKIAFIRALAAAGLRRIEATSFVSPKAVPQLADAAEVAQALPVGDGVEYSALVPNEQGLERALGHAAVTRLAVFTAASDDFTRANVRMTVDETLAVFAPLVARAREAGRPVRGYVSTAFVCPYAGEVEPERVVAVARALVAMGCDEIAIGDTIGAAAPRDVDRLLDGLLEHLPVERIALHLHDTYGTALANACAGLRRGVSIFDASAGGLGGCPYAPGAAGNLATEDLVYLLDRMGIESGVALAGVVEAARGVAAASGVRPASRQYRRLADAASCRR